MKKVLFSDPLCVITEFAPYGDLLGFLRKKRGLKDNYYNIEHLPKRNLTSRQLMRFAWEIADGMAYLSSVKVRFDKTTPVVRYSRAFECAYNAVVYIN